MSSTRLQSAWDCHVHCFEPDKFPYKATRAYTPRPAPFAALVRDLVTSNVMLVQATIEQSFTGLLEHLEACLDNPEHFPGRVRGTVLASSENRLDALTDAELDRMHYLGVRCVRLHSLYGTSNHGIGWIQTQLKELAQLQAVFKYKWSISAQLSLKVWSELKDFILTDTDLATVSIVADHIGSATPSDYGSPAFQDFVELLQSGRVYVKISAMHRRSPGDILAMQPIVDLFAKLAPQALLWGSDWPHVDTSGWEEAGPLEGADPASELATLRSWLSEEQMQKILVENPERLFGH
ncbi:hypothetical protein E8E13_009986 [Curvularia kusanoi]|uniref:Amidohydrolase-related domain-containing protein n=1 Tax=Curvularia kusanoi TaxID=90978 RepID=A0A9P4WBF4_CURKU|nr:hypothetical protein E8E13_009986 [Curvularia kusanoi]